MQRQIKLGLVVFREDHTEPPFRKAHLRPIVGETETATGDEESDETDGVELATQVRGTYFYKQSQVAVKYLRGLLGAKVFNNPKDHVELSRLFEYVLDGSDGIVMDFFAGSGSTAEAVFELGARTGQNCPVILVQIPESLEANLATATGGAKSTIANSIKYLRKMGKPLVISELTKLRVRAAGSRVTAGKINPKWIGDVGFRSFRIDESNMTDVGRTADETDQSLFSELVDSVKPDRTGADLLFQVLLDWGLELTLPISVEQVDGHEIFSVDDDALIACFDTEIDPGVVRAIAKREPLRAVFRDSAFASDDARINADQTFHELSPSTDVKAI